MSLRERRRSFPSFISRLSLMAQTFTRSKYNQANVAERLEYRCIMLRCSLPITVDWHSALVLFN